MPTHFTPRLLACLLAVGSTWGAPAAAQEQTLKIPKDGYLCCNLRLNGTWASDANTPQSGVRLLPVGSRVIGLAYGSQQVDVEIDGHKISIGNDYSRTLSIEEFAARWIVPKNPTATANTWSPRVRQAIKATRVAKGMSRKQVLMSLGWPTTSNTPNMDDPVWQYRASNGSDYKVVFNEHWLVKAIDADDATKKFVLLP